MLSKHIFLRNVVIEALPFLPFVLIIFYQELTVTLINNIYFYHKFNEFY